MYEKVRKVEIIGEGKQLLELACKKYRLSRESIFARYAELMGNYDVSIERYFRKKVNKIKEFEKVLEKDLGKPYRELIDTVEDQLTTYIEGVRDNIYIYNEGEDHVILKQMIEEAQKYKKPYLEIIAWGNLGRFKANLRLNDEAKVILYETIEKAEERGYWDLVVYYYTNLAYVQNLEGNFSNARKTLQKVEKEILEQYPFENNMVRHQYWYIYGYTMSSIGKSLYASARKKFEKAMEFAESMDNEIKCLINIAWLYMNEENFDKAISTYETALKLCNRQMYLKATVLNNISNFYIVVGDREKARQYINKAIDIMPKNLNVNRKIAIFDTYLSLEENCEEIMEELIQSIRENSKIIENRKYVYQCIDVFIGKLRNGAKYSELIQLENALMEQIEREVKGEDIRELKIRLGDIGLILKKEGGYQYEKEISSNDAINPSD